MHKYILHKPTTIYMTYEHDYLMFPHVYEFLHANDFVDYDSDRMSTVSSTIVRLIHQVYQKLNQAPKSRRQWL